MRTRILTHMTNTEIEQNLKCNDVIFIPVGTVEPHVELPIGAEYVGPLVFAMKLEKKEMGWPCQDSPISFPTQPWSAEARFM